MTENEDLTFGGYLGPDFQLKIFWQLLVEPDFAEKMMPYLSASYFDNQILKRFFIVMKEYADENGKPPNIQNKSIDLAIQRYKNEHDSTDEELLKAQLEKIKNWDEGVLNGNIAFDGDVVQKEAWFFIKQQEYKRFADYISAKVKSGDIRSKTTVYQIEENIKKISNIGDVEDYGIEIFENIESALKKDHRNPIPTGIKVLDEAMGGGLGRGEIGLMLAPSGVGKTSFLTKVANTALDCDKNVLQIIFEDTKDQVRRKHYSIWSGIKLSEFDDNIDLIRDRIIEYHKNINSKLVIIKFPQEGITIPYIKNWVERYQKKFGVKFDEIILDYLDCIEPHKKPMDQNDAELIVIKAFESMAAELDIPMWSAIQTNRSGFGAAFVDVNSTGGSIKRVQKSHFFMSVAKSPEQKRAGLANIQILKARFAGDGQQFEDAIFDNDSMRIEIREGSFSKNVTIGEKVTEDKISKLEDKVRKISGSTEQSNGNIPEINNKEVIEPSNDEIEFDEEFSKYIDSSNEPDEVSQDGLESKLAQMADKQKVMN